MPDMTLNIYREYTTWYDFKRDLESKLGRFLPVNLWLCTKPKKPLPWNNNDLQVTLSEVLRIQKFLKVESNRFRAD